MTRRPLSITLISWLFIAVGGIGLLAGFTALLESTAPPRIAEPSFEFWLSQAVRFCAIVSGVFMLYGFNWARWLLVVWLGYHVILSVLHSPFELIVHSLLFAVVAYFLFRPEASAYFRA